MTCFVNSPSSKCYLCRIPDILNIPGAIINMSNDIDQFPDVLFCKVKVCYRFFYFMIIYPLGYLPPPLKKGGRATAAISTPLFFTNEDCSVVYLFRECDETIFNVFQIFIYSPMLRIFFFEILSDFWLCYSWMNRFNQKNTCFNMLFTCDSHVKSCHVFLFRWWGL